MIDVDKIVKSLQKNYSGVVQLSSQKGKEFELVTTGNLAFDLISEGGIPFGLMTEFIGLSQSGKSLFCQMILANAQNDYDAVGVVVDRENSMFEKRAAELNIDTDKVIKCPPSDAKLVNEAFTFLIDSIETIRSEDEDQHIVCIIDSIAAFDKDVSLEKSDSGRKQKATKDGLRKLMGIVDDKVMVLIVNQFYYAIGVMFGDPKRASGGEGLKYFNTVRIALEDRKQILDESKGNEVIGNWLGIEVIKTRLGPCYRTCYVPFYYESGIPYYGGYARLLANRGYLIPNDKAKWGSFKNHTFAYGDKKRISEFGIEKFIEENPDLLFSNYPDYHSDNNAA